MVNNTNLVLLILYIFIAKILYIFILKRTMEETLLRKKSRCPTGWVKMGEVEAVVQMLTLELPKLS